jgi:hypothetical protein
VGAPRARLVIGLSVPLGRASLWEGWAAMQAILDLYTWDMTGHAAWVDFECIARCGCIAVEPPHHVMNYGGLLGEIYYSRRFTAVLLVTPG